MNSMWLFLKENVKCGTKLSDVLCRPERCHKKLENLVEENTKTSELVQPLATPVRELIYGQNYTRTRLYELEIGDPARKIVEIIFRKAALNPTRPATASRIKTILKNYREKVKLLAYDKYMNHPRSMVDGNELLRFFNTTMACCGQSSRRISELCKHPNCRVCRILQSNFGIELALNDEIKLSSSCEMCSEKLIGGKRVKNIEKAVIVCRTIAGSLDDMNCWEYGEYDWNGDEKVLHKLENLVVRNPSAVLPCFVIVFA
ncbi:hypothetical protein UlMin_003787 [Ulmus minor]